MDAVFLALGTTSPTESWGWQDYGLAGLVIGSLLALLGWKLKVDANRDREDRKARLQIETKSAEQRDARELRVVVAQEQQYQATREYAVATVRLSDSITSLCTHVKDIGVKVDDVCVEVAEVGGEVREIRRDLDEISVVHSARERRESDAPPNERRAPRPDPRPEVRPGGGYGTTRPRTKGGGG